MEGSLGGRGEVLGGWGQGDADNDGNCISPGFHLRNAQ